MLTNNGTCIVEVFVTTDRWGMDQESICKLLVSSDRDKDGYLIQSTQLIDEMLRFSTEIQKREVAVKACYEMEALEHRLNPLLKVAKSFIQGNSSVDECKTAKQLMAEIYSKKIATTLPVELSKKVEDIVRTNSAFRFRVVEASDMIDIRGLNLNTNT